MRSRCWCTYALLAMLPVAAMVQPWTINMAKDLNGDTRIDVLDMQLLVSALLCRGNVKSDLNGDGRVDVLDLQAFLADEGCADDQDTPIPMGYPPALAPAPAAAPQPHAAAWWLHLVSTPALGEALPSSPNVVPLHPASTETMRYLFRLTSHAPPIPLSMRHV